MRQRPDSRRSALEIRVLRGAFGARRGTLAGRHFRMILALCDNSSGGHTEPSAACGHRAHRRVRQLSWPLVIFCMLRVSRMHEMASAVAMSLIRVRKHESLTIATDFVGTVMCNVSLNMVAVYVQEMIRSPRASVNHLQVACDTQRHAGQQLGV